MAVTWVASKAAKMVDQKVAKKVVLWVENLAATMVD